MNDNKKKDAGIILAEAIDKTMRPMTEADFNAVVDSSLAEKAVAIGNDLQSYLGEIDYEDPQQEDLEQTAADILAERGPKEKPTYLPADEFKDILVKLLSATQFGESSVVSVEWMPERLIYLVELTLSDSTGVYKSSAEVVEDWFIDPFALPRVVGSLLSALVNDIRTEVLYQDGVVA